MIQGQCGQEFPQRVIWLTETFRWQAAYDKLAEHGILSVHLPLTASRPLTHNTLLWQAVCQIKQYDWLIFPDAEEAELFFDMLLQCRTDVRALGHIKLLAGNQEAEQAVRKRGVFCAFPPCETQEETVRKMAEQSCRRERALVLSGQHKAPGLLCACSRYGIAFDEVPVCQMVRTGKKLDLLLPDDFLVADLPQAVEAVCGQLSQQERGKHILIALTEGAGSAAQQAGFMVLRLSKKSVPALLKLFQTKGGETHETTTDLSGRSRDGDIALPDRTGETGD